MNHANLAEYLFTHYQTGLYKRMAVLLIGGVGVGKSQGVLAASQRLAQHLKMPFLDHSKGEGFGYIDLRIAQLDSVDFRGLPDPVGKWTSFKPSNLLPLEGSDWPDYGLIMYDEITLGDRLTRGCMYQAILDFRMGLLRLKPGWMQVAATNRAEDKCDIDELPAALRNRFLRIELSPSVADYCAYIGPDKSTAKYLTIEPKSFIGNPEHPAFATPRTWERTQVLVDELGPQHPQLAELLHGLVGEVAPDFMRFLLGLKDYEKIVDGIISGKHIAPVVGEDLERVTQRLVDRLRDSKSASMAATSFRYVLSLPGEKFVTCIQKIYDSGLLDVLPKDSKWQSVATEIGNRLKAIEGGKETDE